MSMLETPICMHQHARLTAWKRAVGLVPMQPSSSTITLMQRTLMQRTLMQRTDAETPIPGLQAKRNAHTLMPSSDLQAK